MTQVLKWTSNPHFSGFHVAYDAPTETYTASITVYDTYTVSGSGFTPGGAVLRLRWELGRLQERLATDRGDLIQALRA